MGRIWRLPSQFVLFELQQPARCALLVCFGIFLPYEHTWTASVLLGRRVPMLQYLQQYPSCTTVSLLTFSVPFSSSFYCSYQAVIIGDRKEGRVTDPHAFLLEGANSGWTVVWVQTIRGRMETWLVVYRKTLPVDSGRIYQCSMTIDVDSI